MIDPRIEQVLATWFAGTPSDAFRRWFTKDPAFDDRLRHELGDLHTAAARGELDAWRATPRGMLALIVLLDQIPRNIVRDDPRAFATDAIALGLCRSLCDAELPPLEQMVALLPYQHSEDPAVQAEGVAAFALLVERARRVAPELAGMLEGALEFARRHQAIIDRFGRFPHRNEILGRSSTTEEVAFLREPGSSF